MVIENIILYVVTYLENLEYLYSLLQIMPLQKFLQSIF